MTMTKIRESARGEITSGTGCNRKTRVQCATEKDLVTESAK